MRLDEWRSYLAESPLDTHSQSISDLYDDIDYKCQPDTHAMVDWRILSLLTFESLELEKYTATL